MHPVYNEDDTSPKRMWKVYKEFSRDCPMLNPEPWDAPEFVKTEPCTKASNYGLLTCYGDGVAFPMSVAFARSRSRTPLCHGCVSEVHRRAKARNTQL